MPVMFFLVRPASRNRVCFAARNSSSIAASGERNTLLAAAGWSSAQRCIKNDEVVVPASSPTAVTVRPLIRSQGNGNVRQLLATASPRPLRDVGHAVVERCRTANREPLYFKMNDLSKDHATLLEVGEEADGQRLDNYLLKQAKGVPKSHVYRIVRSGEVRVNKGRIGADYRLKTGDVVRVPPIRTAVTATSMAPARNFDVVFEDEALIILNKPSGTAVHGGSGVSFGVIEQLRRARPQAKLLELAHRLDRETSGLLIVAKKRAALTSLHDMFRDGKISKRYLALIKGRWVNPTQHIKLPLHKYLTGDGERRVSVSTGGKEAHSVVRLKARWENFSLVEVELKTGRTHQIRVHLSHLGFPIAGDDKYGDFALNRDLQKVGLKRMFLHAAILSLRHPLIDDRIAVEASLPPELRIFLRRVEQHEKQDYGAPL
jgi:23S rRNA pseudouridine955/2504/2580 synthase